MSGIKNGFSVWLLKMLMIILIASEEKIINPAILE